MPSSLTAPPEVVKRPLEGWKCMAWAVWDESRGEPLKGSRAVLDVVLKRMKRSGRTACEVVSRYKQFSGWTGERAVYNLPVEAYERFKKVARMRPVAKKCTHFHATYVSPKWAETMQPCYQIGKHIFYKEKK